MIIRCRLLQFLMLVLWTIDPNLHVGLVESFGFPTLSPATIPVNHNLPTQQYQALESIYKATGGESHWRYHEIDLYLGQKPWNFTGSHNPCQEKWIGISCPTNCYFPFSTVSCVVTELSLDRMNLTGSIPNEIGELTSLVSLRLAFNQLNGTLPSGLYKLKELDLLDISQNTHLHGQIPSELFTSLTKLTMLDLSSNNLNGSLPLSFYEHKIIQNVHLEENYLSGSILNAFPNCTYMSTIGLTNYENCSKLVYLDLFDNVITGSIPESIGELPFLTTLLLGYNYITGSIPYSIGKLQNLTSTALGNNLLTSSLPDSFYTLTSLIGFDLQMNLIYSDLKCIDDCFPNLQSLQLYGNSFYGTIPNATKPLSLFEMGMNQLSGRLPTNFNTSYLMTVTVQSNFLTGTIMDIDCDRPLLSEDPINIVDPLNPIYYEIRNAVLEYQREHNSNISNFNYLYSVNFSSCYFTGTLPHWIIRSPLLTFASFQGNMLTGTFPEFATIEDAHNITVLSMGSLSLGNNYLSGTIPSCIEKMIKLVNFDWPSNRFSGTIPPFIFRSNRLLTLILEGNRFTGKLPRLNNDTLPGTDIPVNVSALTSLSVGNNRLTGSLPEEYFSVATSLKSFAAGTNCFTGFIPENICNASTLTGLILEGLSSAKACRLSIFPTLFNSFVLEHGIRGTIPACLFYAMPQINLIDLSGNQLEGSLPHSATSTLYGYWDGSLPTTLTTLRLAYNELTGTIPIAYQNHAWSTLDLSYNRLTGTLSSNFNRPNNSVKSKTDVSISLEVNRLSGNIPSTLKTIHSINILNGNIFQCENKADSLLMGKSEGSSSLPDHDPKKTSYSCGSDAVNQSIYVWVAIIVMILCLLVIFYNWTCGGVIGEEIKTWVTSFYQWNESFQYVVVDGEDTFQPSIGSDGSDKVRPTSATINFNRETNASSTLESSLGGRRREHRKYDDPVVLFYDFLTQYRSSIAYFACAVFICMFPLYRILCYFESSFTYKYAWNYSAIYLSGVNSGIILLISFSIIIAGFYWLLMKALLVIRKHKFRSKRVIMKKSDTGSEVGEQKGSRGLMDRESDADTANSDSFAASASELDDVVLSGARVGTIARTVSVMKERTRSMAHTGLLPPNVFHAPLLMRTVTIQGGIAPRDTVVDQRHATVSRNFSTADDHEPEHSFCSKEKWVGRLLFAIVLLINVIAVTLINIGYVVIYVYVREEAVIILSQFVLAGLKLFWNDIVVWKILFRCKFFLYYRLGLRKEPVLTITTPLPYAQDSSYVFGLPGDSQPVNPHIPMTAEIAALIYSKVEEEDILLTSCCLLFNNVLAPSISVAIVNPSCFYNLFVAAPTITSSYSYCSAYARALEYCEETAYSLTSFNPPFIYNYDCASLFPMSYVSVYIYLTLFTGVIRPLLYVLIAGIVGKMEGSDSEQKVQRGWCSSCMYSMLKSILPLRLRKLVPLQDTSMMSLLGVSDDMMMELDEEVLALKVIVFDRNRFVMTLVSLMTSMVSFGVVFPPLAVLSLVSIFTYTWFEQVSIARILHEANYHPALRWYEEVLCRQFHQMKLFLQMALFPLIQVSCFLYAVLIFDTVGDQIGYKLAVIPAMVMVVVPVIVWWMVNHYVVFRKRKAASDRKAATDTDKSNNNDEEEVHSNKGIELERPSLRASTARLSIVQINEASVTKTDIYDEDNDTVKNVLHL